MLEIGSRSIGSVVREAETLFVLVPRDVALRAEVNVEGKDIGQVAVGQQVRLKFDAFHPEIRDSIRSGSDCQSRLFCA